MKKILALMFACGLCVAAHAASPSAAATPESIEKLLKVTQAEKILDSVRPQIDNMMKMSMQQAMQGKQPTPEEQAVMDKFRNKAVAIMQSELTMAKLKPMYIEVYTKNFTQKEIDGLIAFYESPAGKAFVAKMPVVMQSIMADMPTRLHPMMEQMQKASEEMKSELEAIKAKQPAPAVPAAPAKAPK